MHFIQYAYHLIEHVMQVIVEKAERSDVPDIDKKKLVAFFLYTLHIRIIIHILPEVDTFRNSLLYILQ